MHTAISTIQNCEFLFIKVEQQAAFHLVMKVCRLFGRLDNKEATDYEKLLLRILTPLLKLYTGKQVREVNADFHSELKCVTHFFSSANNIFIRA